MGRPGKSRHQRRERALARERAEREFSSVPHSFVFPRGRAGRSLRSLARDIRRVLEPYTARNLQVRRSNSLRDLVAVAGPLGVTQFVVLSKSQRGVNLKLFRLPGGPTLTFQVLQYSLVRDVVSALRRHRMHEQQFHHPPLLVLGNFGNNPANNPGNKSGNSSGKSGNSSGKSGNSSGQIHLKLMAGMFQGMFPALNVHKVNLNSIRRCLLISYSSDSQLLELRHYSVKVVPVGLSRGLRKILQEKFPNLGRLQDISELLTGEVALSESEAEPDGTQNVTELPQNVSGRGNTVTQQSAIRLTEIGPRLTLQLLKVEEGLGQGNVLYHGLAPKGEAEVRALLARREQRLQAKAERRRKQEQDLERKRRQRELHRERSLAGMGRARAASGDTRGGPGDTRGGPGDPDGDSSAEDPGGDPTGDPTGDPGTPGAGVSEDEDEAEYYRQELGEEPDPDLFPSCSKRKRSFSGDSRPRKRRRKNPGGHPENPKSPKSHPKNSKFHPKNNKSHPENPKSPKSHPKNSKFRPKNPKSHQENPKSHKKPPKSHPKNPKSTKSQQGTPKSHPGTPKSHPGSPKFHPKNSKSSKSHTGNPKSSPKNPKSSPKNPKSAPKNPKSAPKKPGRARGKLLGSRKNSIFQRAGKARKGKN